MPPRYLVVIAAAVFALLAVPVALAGAEGDSGGSQATASASVKKTLKKLKGQVKQLQRQVKQLQQEKQLPTLPGSQGPQGPQGTAPACQGNNASDVMVKAGSVCIDRYEASIWDAATGGSQITGAIPCNANGQNCTNIFARSVPGVIPKGQITWFQAQQALANSGKRLPTNAEWQQAVAGTPDSTVCNISTGSVANTGANVGCVSNHGANDMVGNLSELVADWVPASTACPGWGAFSGDDMCLSGASTIVEGPGTAFRGGAFNQGTFAGPFAVNETEPTDTNVRSGFRGAR